MAQHTLEVESGERFEFGKNSARFLGSLNEERIVQARKSLSELLELETLHGKSFLAIGSGRGLFSTAARQLGARVHSFDYDPHSVKCTRELNRRYFPDDSQWTIEEGSALDNDYLRSLGTFDVVYSWGVLHHTGDMWTALDNVAPLVRGGSPVYFALQRPGHAKPPLEEDKEALQPAPTRSAVPRGGAVLRGAVAHLLQHDGGSGPFPMGCSFENGVVTRFLSI
jgi:hypothetical protein